MHYAKILYCVLIEFWGFIRWLKRENTNFQPNNSVLLCQDKKLTGHVYIIAFIKFIYKQITRSDIYVWTTETNTFDNFSDRQIGCEHKELVIIKYTSTSFNSSSKIRKILMTLDVTHHNMYQL